MNSLKEINWEWERPSLTITETWCHYTAECDLLCCVLCVMSCSVVASLRPRGPTRLLCPWGFPSTNTRVDSHSLLHGIFPTQGLNKGLLHCRQILYVLSPCCPKDSQESSPAPQFKGISSAVLRFLYGPALTFIHDYWENHNFDYMDLCWQNDVFAF